MSTKIFRHIVLFLFFVIKCASSKDDVNIALKKHVTQSGTYLDFEIGNGADNAVDGDTNPDITQQHCSHTKANKNAWLTVDFGNPVLVGSLKIYNRLHDPAYKRLQNFYIRVGDSTNRLQQQLCHHYKGIVPRGDGGVSASNRPHAYIICSARLLGRYVTIQKANDEDTDGDPRTYDGYLSICEVEIFQNRFNDCASNPCNNGATCVVAAHGYTCTCVEGTTGINCETDIDECASNPCQNAATCADRLRGYTCQCATGYTSIHCDKDIDECGSNPCQNGATCTDLPQGYSCACVAGQYTGTQCETDMDNCTKTTCQSGATCRRGPSGSTCICGTGFTGRHCQTDLDECVSNPCRNGGKCEDKISGYHCKCPALFSGTHCNSVLLVALTAASGLLALFTVVILVIFFEYRRRAKKSPASVATHEEHSNDGEQNVNMAFSSEYEDVHQSLHVASQLHGRNESRAEGSDLHNISNFTTSKEHDLNTPFSHLYQNVQISYGLCTTGREDTNQYEPLKQENAGVPDEVINMYSPLSFAK